MRRTALFLCSMMLAFSLGCGIVNAQSDVDAKIAEILKQLDDLQRQLTDLQAAQEQQQADSQQVREAVEEPEGAIQTTIADVAKLKKIKVSGYVQARYESYSTPDGVVEKGDNRAPDDRFYLRRGRFKITGQPTSNTVGVVQLDISGYDRTKVESKDLYLEWHPWGVGTPGPFLVRVGQQNWPFGYVIERSSSAREVPERPKIFAGTFPSIPGTPSFAGLFPGERDKGVAIFNTESSKFEWALGLFNGAGTKAGDSGSAFLESGGRFEDNNSAKAIIGRIRYPVTESLHIGTSFFDGSQAVRPVSGAAAVDVDQTRWGLDFQYYLQGASIKGEYVTAREPYFSNTVTTANGTSGTNRRVTGWYLVAVKNIGPLWQAVAQYDVLDDRAMSKTFGKLSTWNLGVIRFLDEATRVKLFYEISSEEKKSVSNNGVRMEMITVF